MSEFENYPDELTEEHFKIAESNGISRKNVSQRYWDYGWDIEKAITKPIEEKESDWLTWKETAIKNGISNPLYNARLKKGMTPEKAATTPIGVGRSKGLWADYKELAESNGIKADTFYSRVRKGDTPEKAATIPVGEWGRKTTYKWLFPVRS